MFLFGTCSQSRSELVIPPVSETRGMEKKILDSPLTRIIHEGTPAWTASSAVNGVAAAAVAGAVVVLFRARDATPQPNPKQRQCCPRCGRCAGPKSTVPSRPPRLNSQTCGHVDCRPCQSPRPVRESRESSTVVLAQTSHAPAGTRHPPTTCTPASRRSEQVPIPESLRSSATCRVDRAAGMLDTREYSLDTGRLS